MAKKALIIEDVMENRYLLSYLLRSHGWEVAEAEDGPTSLVVAPRFGPTVILMDIGLPGGLNGYNLVGLLRAMPVLQKVPIIAVTSYVMGGDREAALAAGCNGYIEKPIDPATFISEVEAIMTAN